MIINIFYSITNMEEDKRSILVKYNKNKKIRYNNQEYIVDVNNKTYICEKINDNINYICCGLWNEHTKTIIWNKDSKSTILNQIPSKKEPSSQLIQELLKRKNILLGHFDSVSTTEMALLNSLLNIYHSHK